MARIVVLAGGGVKSVVAAAAVGRDGDCTFVHADYGQPSAEAERAGVHALAAGFSARRVIGVDLPHVRQLREGLAPGDGAVRDRAPTSAADCFGLLTTLLSVAVECALRIGAASVVTGISRFCDASHLGLFGAGGRAECLPEFVQAYNVMVSSLSGRGSRVSIDAPLMDMNYADVVLLGRRFDARLEATWSCRERGPRPCGRCEPCKVRSSVFARYPAQAESAVASR